MLWIFVNVQLSAIKIVPISSVFLIEQQQQQQIEPYPTTITTHAHIQKIHYVRL